MAGKSWEFQGETKDWDNFWAHKFIRTQLVPGWSAQEGGPGVSSHLRQERTQTYLRRPCVMNPEGGPQEVGAADIHATAAARSLARVDAERRAEFHRRKGLAEINEGLSRLKYTKKIQQNLGYPFNKGMDAREVPKKKKNETEEEIKERERAEILAQLRPERPTADFDKDWDRDIIGKIVWKDTRGHSKDNSACTCVFDESGELTEKKEDCPVEDISEEDVKNFHSWHSWLGLPIGWQDGYLEFRDVGENPPVTVEPEEKAKPETDLVVAELGDDEEGAQADALSQTGSGKLSKTGSGKAGSTLSKTGSKDTARLSKTGSKEAEKAAKPTFAPKPDGHCKHCKQLVESHHGPERHCYAGTWVVWHGPEEDPKWLDTFIWKPLAGIGPGLIKAAGAENTARNLELGRAKDPPRELLPKRTYLKEETHQDALKGGKKTVKYQSHVAFDNNVHTRDWLTGMTTYKFNQQEHTKTNALGHGTLDKKELIRRKEVKMKQLEKTIGEFSKSILKQEKAAKKAEDDCLAEMVTVQKARDKIEHAEKLIKELRKQQGYLEIRLEQEKREIKALKHELEVMHIARDLPVPKIDPHGGRLWQPLILAMHPKQVSSMADLNYSLNPLREVVGIETVKEEVDEVAVSSDEDDEEGLNIVGLFFKGQGRQNKTNIKKGEKYFGQPLIVPATGVLNIPVVNRKNKDLSLKAKEDNKAVADIFMARSRGKPLLPRPDLEQKGAEKLARIEQQGKVNALLTEVFQTDPMQDLEAWAKSQARRTGVFGSSVYPAAKPEMETVQKIIIDGRHKMPTDLHSWKHSMFERNVDGSCLTCGKAEANHRGTDPKFCYDTHYRRAKKGETLGDKIGSACSSGKVVGSTRPSLTESTMAVKAQLGRTSAFHTAFQAGGKDAGKYELEGWGPELGDQWAVGTALASTYGVQCRSVDTGITPNVSMMCGLEAEKEDARKGPYADTLVRDRAFNGVKKKRG